MISHSSWDANLDNKGSYIIGTISDRQRREVYILFIVFAPKRSSRYTTRTSSSARSSNKQENLVKDYTSVPL